MVAVRLPAAAVIVAAPTVEVAIAVVVALPVPLTPEVLRFWSLTKPLTVVVSAGFVAPYRRFAGSAVTVRWALPMVRVPSARVLKS